MLMHSHEYRTRWVFHTDALVTGFFKEVSLCGLLQAEVYRARSYQTVSSVNYEWLSFARRFYFSWISPYIARRFLTKDGGGNA